jgi:phosphoglycerate dehydrogenase-like enzyme
MRYKIAVLDDYQQVAESFADWKPIQAIAEVTFFYTHEADLTPFDILCLMRERTPLNRETIQSLPNLKLIVSTGMRNAAIDMQAAAEKGIIIKHTGYLDNGAPELTWALLMALAKNITTEAANFKNGNWQTTIGKDLAGKTIGLVGLGRVGSKIAKIANAFDMHVIAWSQNLTEEKATTAGAKLVSKEELFKTADFVSIHLVLSERPRGIIGLPSLQQMKPTAYFINTSRGPLVDENALIKVLQNKTIAGAALDVYDQEPLPKDHPFRSLNNLLATSHIGYVTENTYKIFYGDTVQALAEWMANN